MTAEAALSLDEAIRRLEQDPTSPVRAQAGDLVVELRVVDAAPLGRSAADLFESIGPWEGETEEELQRLLREARKAGGQRSVRGI
jgi:hypothetical protein